MHLGVSDHDEGSVGVTFAGDGADGAAAAASFLSSCFTAEISAFKTSVMLRIFSPLITFFTSSRSSVSCSTSAFAS